MMPYYYGFKGKVEHITESQYKISGIYKIINENTVRITELPLAGHLCWIEKYEEFLKKLLPDAKSDQKKKDTATKIVNYSSNCTNNKIDFEVVFRGNELQKLVKKKQETGEDEIEKYLKLSAKMSTTNLCLYNEKGFNITKYESAEDILENFYEFRLKKYEVRRKHHLKLLNNELTMLKYKVKFIDDVIEDKIIIKKKKKEEIIEKLVSRSYPKMSKILDAPEDSKTYDYLTSMSLFSLTREKIDELNKEYDAKKQEHDEYNSTTPKDLWKKEIEEFIKFYNEWIIERGENELNVKKTKTKTRTKSRTK
jgi:DNA topoisomerase-2